ncbi:MAG: hypothetical protein KA184_13915 [Candidatus Hydrogenedentes bacterium]|nr:hypothetical protein [Candidatus Hydrogenedentota bacterium]
MKRVDTYCESEGETCTFRKEVVGVRGFEPPTSWSRNKEAEVLSADTKGLTGYDKLSCTNPCTRPQGDIPEPEADPVAALADNLRHLPPEEWTRLLQLMTSHRK